MCLKFILKNHDVLDTSDQKHKFSAESSNYIFVLFLLCGARMSRVSPLSVFIFTLPSAVPVPHVRVEFCLKKSYMQVPALHAEKTASKGQKVRRTQVESSALPQ
jgi:hypothetical protein